MNFGYLWSQSVRTFSLPRPFNQVRFASKKSGGSSRNGRKSAGKRLGIKRTDGEKVVTGHILMRQRGYKFHPGAGVVAGRDHTLVAVREGNVKVHYEIEGGRRFISVDDGSMSHELHPSKESIRNRLIAKIDAVAYVKMNASERFALVAQKTLEIKEEMKVVEANDRIRCASTNYRVCRLVDLTLVK